MADRSEIEWTDATWNPVRGCTRVSEGCRNCYAEVMAARFSDPPSAAKRGQWGHGLAQRVTVGGKTDHRWTGKVELVPGQLELPLRWKKPRRIFVNSTSDLFHEGIPDDWIDQVFAIMALAPQHTFQVLTKRPERMRAYAAHPDRKYLVDMTVTERLDSVAAEIHPTIKWPLPNVWLGTSVEDQATAEERIPHLLATPAALRFISAEPMLAPVDLFRITGRRIAENIVYKNNVLTGQQGDGQQSAHLDWVICGGESGPGARPMHADWARSLRDQSNAAGVAFFFKQWGEWGHAMHMEGVSAVSNAPPKSGNYAHPHRYRVHGGPEDGQCFESHPEDHHLLRVGKARSGRLLDGREWNEVPG